jgi:dTDP-4-dehydrorhamnose reductase
MLGRAWRELMDRRGIAYRAPSHAEVDVTDQESLGAAVTEDIRLVVNCTAYTNVDGAEADAEAARKLNGGNALGFVCRWRNVPLVHYSTDYVFNGQGESPYPVDHGLDPINVYGATKAEGEQLLSHWVKEHLIIRTSWLYAPWGKNFVRTIARAAKEKPSLKVVNDQRGRPTSSEHLAAASLALLEKGARGVFHVTDGGECTWFDFATEIVRRVNPACRVEPCTTAEFPRPAKRPAYSVLDLSKTERLIGPMPDWQHSLADVLRRLE